MKKLAATATLAIMSMAVFAGTAFASPGEDAYKAKCAMCHGADGAGAMAKKMGSKDLNSAEVQKMSDAELATVISTGKGKMTGFKGKLTDEQISDVVKHIRTLKK